MISAAGFCTALAERDISFVTGVPCSYFSAPIEQLTREGRYVPAVNEGSALALAAGATVAGARAAVMTQNSGLGNLINPLSSLTMTYDIPVVIFVSLRGWPDPSGDEPQHAVMGASTHGLLEALGVPAWTLRAGDESVAPLLDEAIKELSTGRPAVIMVEKGAVEPYRTAPPEPSPKWTRSEAMAVVVAAVRGLPVVSTTGFTSRDLFAHGDADNQFYMQGSMGHASAFALGLALRRPGGGPVVVLDGDGAALMHLGALSTIGSVAPVDLVHIIFDNHAYESTGAQATTSAGVDFAALGLAAGYRTAGTARGPADLRTALTTARDTPGPHLVVVPVERNRGPAPSRATSAVTAPAIHARFTAALGATAPWSEPSGPEVAGERK